MNAITVSAYSRDLTGKLFILQKNIMKKIRKINERSILNTILPTFKVEDINNVYYSIMEKG